MDGFVGDLQYFFFVPHFLPGDLWRSPTQGTHRPYVITKLEPHLRQRQDYHLAELSCAAFVSSSGRYVIVRRGLGYAYMTTVENARIRPGI